MPKYKICIMTDDKPCTDCNLCDMCDLDPDKICNNCFDCIDRKDVDYAGIEIEEILTEENSIVLDELDIDDQKKVSQDPMIYADEDGHTLDPDAYDEDGDELEEDLEEEE